MKNCFESLKFTNSFASLPDNFYSLVSPTPFNTPARLIHFNQSAAKLLDIDNIQNEQKVTEVFSGTSLLDGSKPLAMLYAGHQFGHFVSQLGDGRAITLGETKNNAGDCWEIQLKGSGITPYSRGGDGRAVLRSSIREYLCSEAMHGLGIPTTRALCLVGSEDEIYREEIETGAILTRLAQSHVRFGSFEVFYYREQFDQIKILADYVIEHHFPDLAEASNPYISLLQTVSERTASLIAKWQAVGFSHGVMNSDNMSILGLTMDYGPYGFMETYNPDYICNHSDHEGRYAFNNQPKIGLFNISCLAQALLPLMDIDDAKNILGNYETVFLESYHSEMAEKLGFKKTSEDIQGLVNQLLSLMQNSGADYTNTFRLLCGLNTNSEQAENKFSTLLKSEDHEKCANWIEQYKNLLSKEHQNSNTDLSLMLSRNPKYILRNYIAQIAINKAENGDYSEIETLLNILHDPYSEHPEHEHYTKPPPEWAENIQISCSS